MNAEQVERLRAAVQWAADHPEDWDQGDWATGWAGPSGNICRTAGCLAMGICQSDGWVPHFHPDWVARLEPGEELTTAYCTNAAGREADIEHLARTLVGLDGGQAERLFHATNSIRDLWAYAHEFSDGRIQRPVVAS